ncbi:MAG: alanine racemase [Fidelibacterota bacterium]
MRIVPTADINLNHLTHNYQIIRNRIGDARMFGVIKANAYGHGIIQIAKSLEQAGIDGFCVAVISEIEQLINAGIRLPILHLGRLHKEILELNHSRNIWYTVNSFEDLEILQHASQRGQDPIVVHLKVDTGMGRLGVPLSESLKLAEALVKIPHVKLEGLWSHLSTSEEDDEHYFLKQLNLFSDFTSEIRSVISGIQFCHIANSSAVMKYPQSHFDLVRPGISLYGSLSNKAELHNLKPVMTMNAPVTLVKHLLKGDSVGYNCTYILNENSTIAIVQAGYADGIPLNASNRGKVCWKGNFFPIVGKVSMDMLAIDVTGSSIKTGDIVNLWGGENDHMRVERVAASLEKIPYELLVSVSSRVERNYIGNS